MGVPKMRMGDGAKEITAAGEEVSLIWFEMFMSSVFISMWIICVECLTEMSGIFLWLTTNALF